MKKRITYMWVADKCICILIILSMLFVVDVELAGFPVYSLLLLMIAALWMIAKIIYESRVGKPFLTIRYLTDAAAIAAILYAILSVIVGLWGISEKESIDFSWNAEVIALAAICILVSSGIQFKLRYLDLLLYSGLLAAGIYMLTYLIKGWEDGRLGAVFADSGSAASSFLLVSMVSVYAYCNCRDRMRSLFYMLVSGISFFVLFLNQNVISLWLMGIYFLTLPVMRRPRALFMKKEMQMFFMYLFMLSNMSFLVGYTQIVQWELSYPPENSVYLDLLLAVGGIFFFHYWEHIPQGVDLERLVLRKMQKGFRRILLMALLMLVITFYAGDGWTGLADGIANDIIKAFALPLVETLHHSRSGYLDCFQTLGAASGIFFIFCMVLFIERMRVNYQQDKTVTDFLILVSGIFFVQLLFWNPGRHNIGNYFYLLMAASFYEEEPEQVTSVGIKVSDLTLEVQKI